VTVELLPVLPAASVAWATMGYVPFGYRVELSDARHVPSA
jgi:hypothetical protein